MKKKSLLLLALLIIPVILSAETNLSGEIDTVQSWTPKYSPYIVSEPVVISKKGFVTIYPGTVIKFKEKGQIIVKGAMYAKGSPKNPVRFLPFDGTTFYDGIRFESSYKNTIEFSIMIRGAIISEGSRLVLNNNYILNSTGVELFHFAKAEIKNNYFYNNTYGVYVEGQQIQYNITGNTFNKCRFGIYLKSNKNGAGAANQNNFIKNRVSFTNYTPANISAKNSYWGLASEKRIERTIYDKRNNKKVGNVIYKPYSKSKLRLFSPPSTYVSLVKLYLKLKRSDEQPTKVSVGGGILGFMPLTPDYLSEETEFGLGVSVETTFNITGAFLFGVEGRTFFIDNVDKSEYDYNLSMTNIYLNFYGYFGWQPKVFFLPYFKIGNGVSLLTQQYKADTPIFDGGTSNTQKFNEISYTAHAGLGLEWFMFKFFSWKLEAMYNYTFSEHGNISFPYAGLTGTVYFDAPFFLNVK